MNGKVHKEDGPAVIYSDGDTEWYINGKLHRTDGPAVLCSNGYKEWCINDTEYTFEEYCEELNLSQEQILKLTLKYNI